jgi:hypothetical protein
MGTFHTRQTSHQPSILVGWAAGLLQTWPEEAPDCYEVRRPHQASSPDEILDALAAAEGMDPEAYAARHLADAGALLALTHHDVPDILAAALEVPGDLAPSEVLAVLEHGTRRAEPTLDDRQSTLVLMLAS